MKRINRMSLLILAVSGLAFALSACGGGGDKGKLDGTKESNILVAYFSATGTTEGVAEKIAEATWGELYEIVPQVPYTEDDLKYYTDCRADREQSDPSARPAIQGSVESMAEYDVVYLGYPIWHSKAPKIIYTFLESYDLSGKTIVPFCTSGSSPISGSLPEIQALASGATWLSGKRFSGEVSQDSIREWIGGLESERAV